MKTPVTILIVAYLLLLPLIHYTSYERGLERGYGLRIEDERDLIPKLIEELRWAWERDQEELSVDVNSPRLIVTRKAVLESLYFWQNNRKITSPIASK